MESEREGKCRIMETKDHISSFSSVTYSQSSIKLTAI